MRSFYSLFIFAAVLMFSVTAAASTETAADNVLADTWEIKRQVLSKPGVLLDMANMTDSGYQWTNDIVWEGADLPSDKNWFIAGFLFERTGYKGVWLQYTFSVNEENGKVSGVRRWFGKSAFR